MCGILLNRSRNRLTCGERIILSRSGLTRRSEGVHRHEAMGRDPSSCFGGESQSASDSPRDGDALEDAAEDSGAQRAARLSARGSLQQAEDRAVSCLATASDLFPPSSVGGRTCFRQILEDDRRVPRKQRQTAKRIFERIQQEGYTGGYTQVTEAVREIKQKGQEVFVPLIHRPGEAQVDFGFALVNVNGQLRKLPFFVMTLPYSDAIFVQVYERMSTEIYSRRTPPSIRVLRWCTRSDHV